MFDPEDNGKSETENTTFSEALSRANGLSRAGMTLYLACCSYTRKDGASLYEFRKIFDRVINEFDWGIDDGDEAEYDEDIVDDDEAIVSVPDKGRDRPASASPKAAGEANQPLPDKGQNRPVSPVRPKANPARGISAIAAIQPVIEKGLLEMRKTHDGRVWGSVGWNELDGMDRDGTIAKLIKQRANPPKDPFTALRDVISNKLFEEVLNASKN